MVQIVKLGDAGVTRLEHLDIKLRGDSFVVFGRDAREKAVHQFAPCPEIIVARAAFLGEPRHGALEGMRMHIGHARQQRTGHHFRALGRGIGVYFAYQAVVADVDQHIAAPAGG